jgi:hypothetical protein
MSTSVAKILALVAFIICMNDQSAFARKSKIVDGSGSCITAWVVLGYNNQPQDVCRMSNVCSQQVWATFDVYPTMVNNRWVPKHSITAGQWFPNGLENVDGWLEDGNPYHPQCSLYSSHF